MKIQAKIENLPRILTLLHEKGAELKLDSIKIHQMEIALEEVIVNIIQHAYRNEGGEIDVQFDVIGSDLCVTVRDWAPSFNPVRSESKVDRNKPIQERELGGLGLLFIKKFTDRLQYQELKNGNELKLFKKI